MNAPVSPPAVRTTCPYCGVGCGVVARPDGFGGAQVQGDPEHPANFGRLCSKGSALGETLSLEGRLLHPMLRDGQEQLVRGSWDAALDAVAQGFTDTIERHGPDSVAFYVSGQLLTEDYYVANKLMKGFIGSANIDTNSRLCMASSVAGHRRAFGSDTVPGCYEDLDEADLLVLVGSNAAWCHPVLYQRMAKNKRERGARIVVIDPRATPTADEADLLIQIAPGMDSVLFCGLFAYLADRGVLDRAFLRDHTSGYAEALARARHIAPDIDAVAERCEVARETIESFFAWFAETERAVTLYSQGVNQSAQGTDKVNAIINCHLATGRIGKAGMGPFSLTGQPNAMGGREVGGLANQLAAHMDFDASSTDRVRRFWSAPAVAGKPGLKAVDLFEAVAQGRIKALWIMATNPVVSLPRADAVASALRQLDLFVVSDVAANTDTISAGAHVLLPAAGWGEKDGTVTNSERRISRQRAFLPPAGEARPDWWIVAEVAKRMGFADAFSYASAADIFREHVALSGFENGGARDFDASGLATLSDEDYDHLAPVQWPVGPMSSSGGRKRLFASGGFFTSDRRARFVAVAAPKLAAAPDRLLPLLLNTGRVRDHWHTMTRTGKSPRLGAHVDEPCLSIHPADAEAFGVVDGGFGRISTLHGSAVLRVAATPSQRRGEIFAPIHWNGTTASDARVGALVQQAYDPVSGQPEMKATQATIAPVSYAVHGFLLSRTAVRIPDGAWWARSAVEGGYGYRLAAPLTGACWTEISKALLGADESLVELLDEGQGRYRAAVISDGSLQACLFLARSPDALPGWEWLKQQLAAPTLTDAARRALLAGRPEAGTDQGPLVCACFGVGRNQICAAVAGGRARSAEEIGTVLKAGTNCGSCLPEVRRLVAESKEHAMTA